MAVLVLIVVILVAMLVYGLAQLYRSRERPRQAVQSVIYIVVYPAVACLAWLMRPIPPWLLAPLVLAALPWLFAGVYLNEIVKDPSVARDGEFVGFPYGYWIGGGLLSMLVGLWWG